MLGLCVLIGFWWAGSALVEWLAWPIPGSVVGLLGLWLVISIQGRVPAWLQQPSSLLLRYLTLLYVPAGVGIITHWERLQAYGLGILGAVILSSVLTALAMIALFKLLRVKL